MVLGDATGFTGRPPGFADGSARLVLPIDAGPIRVTPAARRTKCSLSFPSIISSVSWRPLDVVSGPHSELIEPFRIVRDKGLGEGDDPLKNVT